MSGAGQDGEGESRRADAPPPIDPRLREHSCFGCGDHNSIGLHLHFDRTDDGVAARYQPRREDQGFPGLVHGGLLALLLDEAMGWAMYADEVFAVTARMETRFRRPVPLDMDLVVRARIRSSRGRRLEVEGELHGAPAGGGTEIGVASELLAEAVGLFVRMSPQEQRSAPRRP